MGARWYDPTIGLWTQPDTLVPNPLDPLALNRYSFVEGDPLRYWDPSGHTVQVPTDFMPSPVVIDLAPPLMVDQGAISVVPSQEPLTTITTVGPELGGCCVSTLPESLGAGATTTTPSDLTPQILAARGSSPGHQPPLPGFDLDAVGKRSEYPNTEAYLRALAAKASQEYPASGPGAASSRHKYIADAIKASGDASLDAEASFDANGGATNYGAKGSIRLDVVEYDEYGKPVAVYDFKFGSADLTTDRIARI